MRALLTAAFAYGKALRDWQAEPAQQQLMKRF